MWQNGASDQGLHCLQQEVSISSAYLYQIHPRKVMTAFKNEKDREMDVKIVYPPQT